MYVIIIIREKEIVNLKGRIYERGWRNDICEDWKEEMGYNYSILF